MRVIKMSVLQPISFGLLQQDGPGDGAKGYGSYQADNTDVMRPYQQKGASPIGRGYSVSVISGNPTFFTPDVKEDPIVTLLKMLVNQGTKVVAEKEPDAGFRNNLPVFPPAGPAGDPSTTGGNALGAVPAGDRPNAGPGLSTDSFHTASAVSTDYGSLNEFKPELAQLVNIDQWADNVKKELTASIISGENIGVIASPAYSKESQTNITSDTLYKLGELMDKEIAKLDKARQNFNRESQIFRSGIQYITGMIDYLNLAPLDVGDYVTLNEGVDVDEIKRIINGVVETYQFELNKRVAEGFKELADAEAQTRPIRNKRGLRINTGVERAMINAGEQFNRIERTRVEGGRPMDAYMPQLGKRRREKEGPLYTPGNIRKKKKVVYPKIK